MSYCSELSKQLEELDRRIEEAKRSEYGPTLEEVRATIAAFGFSVTEVFGRSYGSTVRSKRGAKAEKRGAAQGKRAGSTKLDSADPRQTQIEFA
jgi:DNA-binding protein H-NS